MRAEVWAPSATRVRVSTIDRANSAVTQRELTTDPERAGWWVDDRELPVGTRYAFLLDDDTDALPDPRGRRLPAGVDGPSEVVDGSLRADTSAWSGRELAGGIVYELHLGTFTDGGTLDSVIDRLDHLVELGVDFVELLPVNTFSGRYNWGYDGVGWFAVDESYGGPEAYVRFVDAAHARGLGVIQDVVYNHLGPRGNHLPRFGPYLAEGRNTWGDSVNLADPEVRSYILDNALMWMDDFGADGLRLDAVHALVDPTPTHLLAELSERTDALSARVGRPLTLIAESDLNDPIMILPRDRGGYGLTAQWSDDYHHSVHVALTGETDGYYGDFESLGALAKAGSSGFVHDGGYSSFREKNHGVPIPPDVEAWRLVTFSQDHDQIGNRATGDRLSATLGPDRLAVGALLTVFSPYTPMLFMGEEWAASTPWQFFTSHPDPDLGEATAKGRIEEFTKMGWDPDSVPDPQEPSTYLDSKLDWTELEREPHGRILKLYRDLIAVRRGESVFASASFADLEATFDDDLGRVELRVGDLRVLANLGDTPWDAGAGTLVIGTSDRVESGAAGVVLPPESGAVIRV